MLDDIKEKIEDVVDDIKDNIEDAKDVEPKKKGIVGSKIKTVIVFIVLILVFVATLIIQKNIYEAKVSKAYDQGKAAAETEVIPVVDNVVVDTTTIMKAIASASELVTSTYNTADFDVLEGGQFLWMKEKTLYAFNGKVGVGIKNMSDIEIVADDDNKTITLTIPKLEIIYNEINNIKTFNISKSIFTKITDEQYTEFRKTLEEKQIKQAQETPELWENAKERAELTIESLIKASGQANDYKIIYKWN